jgi:hypothetical protein
MKFLDKKTCIKTYEKHFDSERKNGIKKAYYTWHYQMDMVNCMDTDEQLKQYLRGCKSQNIVVTETIPMSQNLLDRFGFKSGNIIILRHKNNANISNNLDPLAFSFDYMVGSSEWIIFEVNYPVVENKPTIFKDDTLELAKEKGLKVFEYGSLKISALNKKNAIKKIMKTVDNFNSELLCELI